MVNRWDVGIGFSTEVFFPNKRRAQMTDDMFKEIQIDNVTKGNKVGMRVFKNNDSKVTKETKNNET